MIKHPLIIGWYLLLPFFAFSQITVSLTRQQADSLHSVLKETDEDSLKMVIYRRLASYHLERNRDSCIYFSEQQLSVAKKIKQPLWQGWALSVISYELQRLGNYPNALQSANNGLKIAEDETSENNMYPMEREGFFADPHKVRLGLLANLYQKFGHLYRSTGNDGKAIANYLKAISISESVDDKWGLILYNMSLGNLYARADKMDSALFFQQKSLAISNASGYTMFMGWPYIEIGQIYLQQKKYDTASHYFQLSAKVSRDQKNFSSEGDSYGSLAELFLTTHEPDSTFIYANHALEIYKLLNDQKAVANNYAYISSAYQLKGKTDSAFVYLLRSKNLQDSLTQVDKAQTNRYQNLNFEEQLRLQNVEKEKIQLQANIRMYAMLTGIGVFMLIAFLLYRNNRNRKKANLLLQSQKEDLQSTLSKLKSTQSQLIQSEKMASLGELTAGIAHEIQNPLNFVNNFSDVSAELVDEMNTEIEKGNLEDAKQIAQDLKQNLEKINHHGKRAGDIVKGMLQHSRTSSGQKELTDINALADEYLRLAYHGLRAKDKSFNATMKTDFDESIGNINIIPQDIGRVVLNLINNAFYVVDEKKKQHPSGYEPTVSVSTKKASDKVLISIKDNGNGIPQKVLDKIFQPFFTTKPTGQGTGLGLSLSYDILKAHSGELKVETKEGEFAEFIIRLPL